MSSDFEMNSNLECENMERSNLESDTSIENIASQQESLEFEDEELKDLLELRPTEMGWGVFAKKRIKKHKMIGIITGETIVDANYYSDYCIELDENTALEPCSPYRFVNHSCEPNCEFIWIESAEPGGPPQVLLESSYKIKPGEELSVDYCWPWQNAIPCLCHAPTCRGWVVDEDELEELEDRLRDWDFRL